MANADDISKYLHKYIKEKQKVVLEKFSDRATTQAQKNFDRFTSEVSSDDPFVKVSCSDTKMNKDTFSRTIICKGNQVAFIEFGVGITYSKSFYTAMLERKAPSKPANISGAWGVGSYGKHQGLDDYWVRPSKDGIPKALGEMPVARKDKQGNVIAYRTDVVWTQGHRPSRALWRAIETTKKRLLGGKLK